MKNLKLKIALAAILLLSHLAFYILGSVVNRQVMLSSLSKEFNRTNANVNLGRYTEYRDIALVIKASRYDKAKCSVELGASAMYDDLKSCLTNQNCRGAIEQKMRAAAPEILGEAPLKFTYIKSKDGVKSCE